jgi:hypothetical protein
VRRALEALVAVPRNNLRARLLGGASDSGGETKRGDSSDGGVDRDWPGAAAAAAGGPDARRRDRLGRLAARAFRGEGASGGGGGGATASLLAARAAAAEDAGAATDAAGGGAADGSGAGGGDDGGCDAAGGSGAGGGADDALQSLVAVLARVLLAEPLLARLRRAQARGVHPFVLPGI